jgi:hypothetical protein
VQKFSKIASSLKNNNAGVIAKDVTRAVPPVARGRGDCGLVDLIGKLPRPGTASRQSGVPRTGAVLEATTSGMRASSWSDGSAGVGPLLVEIDRDGSIRAGGGVFQRGRRSN